MNVGSRGLAGMQLVLVDAAAPRLPDGVVAEFAPAAADQLENAVRVAVSFAHGHRHHALHAAWATTVGKSDLDSDVTCSDSRKR